MEAGRWRLDLGGCGRWRRGNGCSGWAGWGRTGEAEGHAGTRLAGGGLVRRVAKWRTKGKIHWPGRHGSGRYVVEESSTKSNIDCKCRARTARAGAAARGAARERVNGPRVQFTEEAGRSRGPGKRGWGGRRTRGKAGGRRMTPAKAEVRRMRAKPRGTVAENRGVGRGMA
jgi:hypothetical protein